MSQKKNNQDIVNDVAAMSRESKKTVSAFVQALTDAVIEGLHVDGEVEIDGVGTFSTHEVAPRESVNVANGEKIIIPSFTKFSFAPQFKSLDKGVETEAPTVLDEVESPMESSAEDDFTTDGDNTTPSVRIETLQDEDNYDNQVEEDLPRTAEDDIPVRERPLDAFSGIDVLISTPESLDDIRERLRHAVAKEAELTEKANQAQQAFENARLEAERCRVNLQVARDALEEIRRMVDNVEQNRKTVIDVEDHTADSLADNPDEPSRVEDNKHESTTRETLGNPSQETSPGSHGKSRKTIFMIIFSVLLCVIIAVLCLLFCGKGNGSNTSKTAKQPTAKVEKGDAPSQNLSQQPGQGAVANSPAALPADSAAADTLKSQPEKKPNAGNTITRVDTVVFDGTQYLEHIVTNHYGDHDMVYKVIPFNRKHGLLKDLNHIPVGSIILLPHYE